MLATLKQTLWGNLTQEECKKFGILSLTFLFIIGTYWLMRPLKDGLFLKIVGSSYLPYAKIASFICIAPLVLLYSKLVDLVAKQKLFYIICSSYAFLFAIVTYLLMHPTIGLTNTVANPKRILGWLVYVSIESFGSLAVALFWSFVASNTDTLTAKRGYPLIIAGAQIGSITGPGIATYATRLGMPLLTAMVVIGILMVPLLIKFFITTYPSTAETALEKKKKTGALEGLKLLLTRPYLLGIFGIATLYDIIGTIIEYQMQTLADKKYHTAEHIAEFIGLHGLATNSCALLFALIGTSFFIRRFGLTFCLVMFPSLVAATIFYIWWHPMIWTLFGAMIILKSLSYSLNNPCKEIMYIPTSKDVQFKAKSWIDTIGGRSAKAVGSGINACFTSITDLLMYGSIISLGIVGVWIAIALYVGKKNQKLINDGHIIE